MDFSKVKNAVANGVVSKLAYGKADQKPLEERVNELTATVENIQQILDRFIALYEWEKVVALSKQESEDKSMVDTTISTPQQNNECSTCLNAKKQRREEMQQSTVLPQKREAKDDQVSANMEKFDELIKENINLKMTMDLQTSVYNKDKLKWEEERDSLERLLRKCESLLKSYIRHFQDSSKSQDIPRGHTKPYECLNCNGFTTYSKDYFEYHINVDCYSTPKYECSICNKQFLHKYNYDKHQNAHDSVEKTGKDVVLEQMKNIEASIDRNQCRQEIRVKHEGRFNIPRSEPIAIPKQQENVQEAVQGNDNLKQQSTVQLQEQMKSEELKKTDEKESEPEVQKNNKIENEKFPKITEINPLKALIKHKNNKEMKFSPQLLQTLKQKSDENEKKVTEMEEIDWIKRINSNQFLGPIIEPSALPSYVPTEADKKFTHYCIRPCVGDKTTDQKVEEKIEETINAENGETVVKSSETTESDKPINLPSVLAEAADLAQVVEKQVKQQTPIQPIDPPLVPAKEVTSAVLNNTYTKDKETGETLPDKQQNVPPYPSWPKFKTLAPVPISDELLDDNQRRNLRQRFNMQLVMHDCGPLCTIRIFAKCVEHEKKCTKGGECSYWNICKRVHEKVEHLKTCQDKTECKFCQPYVDFNEGKMVSLMKILGKGCPVVMDDQPIRIATRQAVMSVVTELAVKYSLVGDYEKIHNNEVPDVSNDLTDICQISTDEDESDSSSDEDAIYFSSSSSSSSENGSSSEEWEVVDSE